MLLYLKINAYLFSNFYFFYRLLKKKILFYQNTNAAMSTTKHYINATTLTYLYQKLKLYLYLHIISIFKSVYKMFTKNFSQYLKLNNFVSVYLATFVENLIQINLVIFQKALSYHPHRVKLIDLHFLAGRINRYSFQLNQVWLANYLFYFIDYITKSKGDHNEQV